MLCSSCQWSLIPEPQDQIDKLYQLLITDILASKYSQVVRIITYMLFSSCSRAAVISDRRASSFPSLKLTSTASTCRPLSFFFLLFLLFPPTGASDAWGKKVDCYCIERTLKLLSDALINAGKHVESNTVCVNDHHLSTKHVKEHVRQLVKIFLLLVPLK